MYASISSLKIGFLIIFSVFATETAFGQGTNVYQIPANNWLNLSIQQLGIRALESTFENNNRAKSKEIIYELEKKCNEGNVDQCIRIAKFYDNDSGIESSDIKAAKYFRQACDTGNSPESCTRLQEINVLIQNVEAFQRGCDRGHVEDCDKLVDAYRYGKGTDSDEDKRFATNLKACEMGSYDGCGSLGYAYQSGEGVKPDFATSLAYFKRACDLEGRSGGSYDSDSCVVFDVNLKEFAEAKEYAKACPQGDADACYELADAFWRGNQQCHS